MPWDMNDYPSSLKNLNKATKKKAIDIANSMIEQGYSEGKAIPIATEQAKEWYNHANRKDIHDTLQHDDPTKRSSDKQSRPELLDKSEMIVPHESDSWAVQSKGAKKPAKVFKNKQDAIDYGKSIAKNKQSSLIVYSKDGNKQDEINYSG